MDCDLKHIVVLDYMLQWPTIGGGIYVAKQIYDRLLLLEVLVV